MKTITLMVCSAAMTLTSFAAESASPFQLMALEAPASVQQIGDHRGAYGGRGYYRRGFYRGGGNYRRGFGGYYGHHDNFWVPGAAFIAGAIIGGALAGQWEPEYRPIYRPYRAYRPYRVYEPYRLYRPYRVYQPYRSYGYTYGRCGSWRQEC
jgi:hypothetical protein